MVSKQDIAEDIRQALEAPEVTTVQDAGQWKVLVLLCVTRKSRTGRTFQCHPFILREGRPWYLGSALAQYHGFRTHPDDPHAIIAKYDHRGMDVMVADWIREVRPMVNVAVKVTVVP